MRFDQYMVGFLCSWICTSSRNEIFLLFSFLCFRDIPVQIIFDEAGRLETLKGWLKPKICQEIQFVDD